MPRSGYRRAFTTPEPAFHFPRNGCSTSRNPCSTSRNRCSTSSEIDVPLRPKSVFHFLRNTQKTEGERILGFNLFEKLIAAGLYDINTVSNDAGEHAFVTSPDSFHKFVNPMVDDCFDLAKALVSALRYGMTRRMPSKGRIHSIGLLLNRLIAGHTVGPATAIGMDYRVLELHRVVQIIPNGNLFSMRLLKREIGMLALDVLTKGDANVTALQNIPGAPMTGYAGPEDGRVRTRRLQGNRSKLATQDILAALRGGRDI